MNTPQRKPVRRMLAVLLAVLTGLLPAGSLLAQGGELPFDTPVQAELREGQTHTYTFRSEGEDSITVRMAGDTLDPVLALFDPAGALLAFNDDVEPGQPEAELTAVRLTLPGVYTLVVRTYGNRGAGVYTLTATSRRAETLDGSAPLALGETVEAELFALGQIDRWVFEAQAGQVISARLDAGRGTQLDPLLELLAADGSVLAYSDDDGGDKNSLINGFSLPANGQYVLVARAWGNSSMGAYSLALTEGVFAADQALTAPYAPPEPGAAEALPPAAEAGLLAVGEAQEGFLRRGEMVVWTLTLADDGVLDFTLAATEGLFDPILTVANVDGARIAENDDFGGQLDSALRGVPLSAGTYRVLVRSYQDEGRGPYMLEVRATSVPAGDSGPVTVGEPLQAELAAGAADRWQLNALGGEVYSLAVFAAGSGFDPVLRVLGEDGREVALDDDTGPYYNPALIGWTVPADGTYIIEVASFDRAQGGAYMLVVEPGAAFLFPEAWRQGDLALDATQESVFAEGETAHVWAFAIPAEMDLTLDYTGGAVFELRRPDGRGVPVFEPGDRLPIDPGEPLLLFVYGPEGRAYSVTLAQIPPPPTNSGPVAPEDTLTATLAEGAADRWTFEGAAGQLVSIGLYALDGAFDPVLRVVDANGVQVAFDDDGGLLRNSLIQGWRVPADGAYTLLAGAFDDRSGGEYALTLLEGDVLIFPEVWLQGELAPGVTVTGRLAAGEPAQVWSFEARGGRSATLVYDAPVTVEIVGETGDSEGAAPSGTALALNRPGTFYVVVSAEAPGVYDLTLDLD